MTFDKLLETIEAEKVIELKEVSQVVRDLFTDEARNKDFGEEYDSYEASPRRKLRRIAKLFRGDDECEFVGRADDYHNLAVDYSRKQMWLEACYITERGLSYFVSSVDLLADMIKYSTDAGKTKDAMTYFEELLTINKDRWTWRAYVFASDFLIERLNVDKGAEEELKEQAYSIVKTFLSRAEQHPELTDKAYFQYAKTIKEYGRCDDNDGLPNLEEGALLKGCQKTKNASRCALRLADIYFERGAYDEAIKYLNMSKLALSKPQPELSGSYLFLLRAMTNTSKLFADSSGKQLSEAEKEIRDIYRDFNTALANHDLPDEYMDVVKATIKILEVQSGLKNDEQHIEDEYV